LATLLVTRVFMPAAEGAIKVKGWRAEGELESYDKKTVWQAINGAAELHVAFGFRGLRQQELVSRKRGDRLAVTAQIYDQGTRLGAFGVFARERPPKAKTLDAGADAAYHRGSHCLAYKARHYVKVKPLRGTLTQKACRALLAGLTAGLPGDRSPPAELALLPTDGRVSLGFTRRSFLGTRRLSRCVHGSYRTGAGKSYTLFVMLPAPKQTIEDRLRELARHWKRQRVEGLEVLATRLPYRGTVALVRAGSVLIGAAGVGDLGATVALLRKLKKKR
jgi:hypothetical protein